MVENWLWEQIDLKLNLRECEILINKDIELINFVILITKWYINSQRNEDKPLFFMNE